MNNRVLALILTVITAGVAHDAAADFTGARATPRQVQLMGTGNNVLSITWQITTTPEHRSGAISVSGDIIDPLSRTPLLRVDQTLNAAGAGPFSIRELLTLDADTVSGWIEQGISRAVLQRTFTDAAGNTASASITLSLQRSRLLAARDTSQGGLAVQSLRIEFDSGNNTGVVNSGESLPALLTVTYSGTGTLRGRWQIAEPGSSEGAVPMFRTLSLVNVNLATSQRTTLRSPALPTGRSGRYLLRFCAADDPARGSADDPFCPDPDLVTAATYVVQGATNTALQAIELIGPNRQGVDPATLFSWRRLDGARVYQLQIFATGPAGGQLPSSRLDSAAIEPEFVAGMLLKAGTSATTLSESTLDRLTPGHEYLWRINAHDESGRLIGKSAESTFVFQPVN